MNTVKLMACGKSEMILMGKEYLELEKAHRSYKIGQ